MSGSDANLHQLVRSIGLLLVLGAVIVALLAALPSLAAVTRQLGCAQAGWVVLAVVAELVSCFCVRASPCDAGPDLHSDLPEPFNLATGLLHATTKERLP